MEVILTAANGLPACEHLSVIAQQIGLPFIDLFTCEHTVSFRDDVVGTVYSGFSDNCVSCFFIVVVFLSVNCLPACCYLSCIGNYIGDIVYNCIA